MNIKFRPATPEDLALLRHWDNQPHVIESDPNDDWEWETELHRNPDWREQLIAEKDGRPPIDIWIGEASDLGKGYGTEMMKQALEMCFAVPSVTAVLIDPLQNNTRAHKFYEKFGFKFLENRRFGKDDCRIYRLYRQNWYKVMNMA